jgi:hypothetical protein
MNIANKLLALIMTFMILSSLTLLTVKHADAQTTAMLAVPQFSLKLVDNSYATTPSTQTTIDPYTGKETITTYPSYHITDRLIEITIKNQQFTPYTDTNGHKIDLYYKIQVKGYYSEDWSDISSPLIQSDSEYTVSLMTANDYDAGSLLDFRVQVIMGYIDYVEYSPEEIAAMYYIPIWRMIGIPAGYDKLFEIALNWSDIQTLSIDDGSVSYDTANPSTSTTLFPSSPSQTAPPHGNPPVTSSKIHSLPITLLLGIIAALLVVIIALTALLFFKMRTKPSTYKNNDLS